MLACHTTAPGLKSQLCFSLQFPTKTNLRKTLPLTNDSLSTWVPACHGGDPASVWLWLLWHEPGDGRSVCMWLCLPAFQTNNQKQSKPLKKILIQGRIMTQQVKTSRVASNPEEHKYQPGCSSNLALQSCAWGGSGRGPKCLCPVTHKRDPDRVPTSLLWCGYCGPSGVSEYI